MITIKKQFFAHAKNNMTIDQLFALIESTRFALKKNFKPDVEDIEGLWIDILDDFGYVFDLEVGWWKKYGDADNWAIEFIEWLFPLRENI